MLLKLESYMNLLFIKLLEKKVNFYFASTVLRFMENPSDNSLLEVAKFCKANYDEFGVDLEKLGKELVAFESTFPGYQKAALDTVSGVLSNYSYTFKERNGKLVQSSLIFLYLQLLPEECMKEMMHFICDKELLDVVSRPQIYSTSSSVIFSSMMHYILEKGWDDIALKLAMNMQNKHLLFVKNMEGVEPLEIAAQKNCNNSFNYLLKLKEAEIYLN